MTTTRGVAPIEKADRSRMSVDLDRHLWCWRKGDHCFQVLSIARAEPGRITFTDRSSAEGDSHISLDRVTGRLASVVHIRTGQVPEIEAKLQSECTMALYTAIP